MKSKRQNKILEIIANSDIETQEELVNALRESGFKVTQATISRDIKDLHLIKVQSITGVYKYSVNLKDDKNDSNIRMRIFKDTVKSIEAAENLIVIKTLAGSASAAAEVIDSFEDEDILGSIAGDNTIFVAMRSSSAAYKTANTLMQIKNG